MSVEAWALIAIASMVYIIGYGLTAAATFALMKMTGDKMPASDPFVVLLWPVLVPLIVARVMMDDRQ